jgi:superfamily II DNA/RNA helicase
VTSVRPAPHNNRRRRPATNHTARPQSGAPQRNAPDTVSRLDDALRTAGQTPDPDVASFAEFALPQPVIDTLTGVGITRPTAIQARTLPDALAGRDVLGRAQTGSGKTLGFGLPMVTRLAASGARRTSVAPHGLVLVPTRELAGQVADALTPVAGAMRLHVAVVVGGTSIGRQVDELRRGVDILIATPGRLIDLMERRAVDLGAVQIAVLDEADHMADLGFMPAVTRILDTTPAGRQCMLFSATLDRAVGRLVTRYLTDPAVHSAGASDTPVAAMEHHTFVLPRPDKITVAAEIGARPGRSLFFVRTKHGADRLAKQLTRMGVGSAAIHGNLNQNQRQRALDAFTTGATRVLVATDVAARGLHVDDLDLVVHFDPPADQKAYLHRSGRTARAGAAGTVVSFVEPEQQREVARLHTAAGITPSTTRVRPGDDAVRSIAESGEPIVVSAAPVHTGSHTAPRQSPRQAPRQYQGGGGRPANSRNHSRRPNRRG